MPGPVYATEVEEKKVEGRTLPQAVSPLEERVAAGEQEPDSSEISEIDEVSWLGTCTELEGLLARLAKDDLGAIAKSSDPFIEMALSLIWEVIEKSALKKWVDLGLLAKGMVQDLAHLRARKDLSWTAKLQGLIRLIEQKATYPAASSAQFAGYTEETFSAAKTQFLEMLHLLASAGVASDAFAAAPLTSAGLVAPLKAAHALIETPAMARALGPQQKLLQDLIGASEQQADLAETAALQDRFSQLWESDLLRSNLPAQWHGVVLVLDELWRLKQSAHEFPGWMSCLEGGLTLLSNSKLESLLSEHLKQRIEPVFSLLKGMQEALNTFHACPAEEGPLASLEWVFDEAAKSTAIAAFLPSDIHEGLLTLRTTFQGLKSQGIELAKVFEVAAANPMGNNAAARMRWLAALLLNPEIQLFLQSRAPGQEQTLKNLAEWLTSAACAWAEVQDILAEPSLSGRARMAVAFLQNADPNRRALVEQWLAPAQLGAAASYFNAYQNAQNLWSRLQDYPNGDLLARLGWGLEVMQDKDAEALMAMVLPAETMRMLEVAGRLLAKFQASENGGALSSAVEWFKDQDARALLGMLAPAGSAADVQMFFELFDQAAAYPSDQSLVDQFRWLAPKLRQHGGTLQNHLPAQTADVFAQVLEWSSIIEKILEYFKDGARPASWQEAVKAMAGLAAVMGVDGAERMIQHMVRFMGYESFVSGALRWVPALKSIYDSFPENADSGKVLGWLADSIDALPMEQKLLRDGFLTWLGWNPAVVNKAAGLALDVIEPLEAGGKFMFAIANMAYLLHKNGWTRVGMEEIRCEVARYMDLTQAQVSLLGLLPVIPGLLNVQKAATAALPENASYRDQANAYLTQLMRSEDPALQASMQRLRELIVQPAVSQVNAVLAADGAPAPDQLQTVQAASSGEEASKTGEAADSRMMRVGIAAAIALLLIGIGRAMIGGMSDGAESQKNAAEDQPQSESAPTASQDATGTQQKKRVRARGRALAKATKLGGAGLTIAILSMLVPGAAATPVDEAMAELSAENLPFEYPSIGDWIVKPEAFGVLIATLLSLLTSAGALVLQRKLAQARARTQRPEEIPLETPSLPTQTSDAPAEHEPLDPTTSAPDTQQRETASTIEKNVGYVALAGALLTLLGTATAVGLWFFRGIKDPFLKEAVEKIEKRRGIYKENSREILEFAVNTVLAEPVKEPENGGGLTYKEAISRIENIPQDDVSGFIKRRVKKEAAKYSKDDEEDSKSTEKKEQEKLQNAVLNKHRRIYTSYDFPLYVKLPADSSFLEKIILRNKDDQIDVSELRKGTFAIDLPHVDGREGRSIVYHADLSLTGNSRINKISEKFYETTYGYGENGEIITLQADEEATLRLFINQIADNNEGSASAGVTWRVRAGDAETETTLFNSKDKIIFEDYFRTSAKESTQYFVSLPDLGSRVGTDERNVDISPLLEAGYPIEVIKTFTPGSASLEEVQLHVYEKKHTWVGNLVIYLKGNKDCLERIAFNTDQQLLETSDHGFVQRITKDTINNSARLGSLQDLLIFDDVPNTGSAWVFKVGLPAFRFSTKKDERDVDIYPLLKKGYPARVPDYSRATLQIFAKDWSTIELQIEFSGQKDIIDRIIGKTHERIEGVKALREPSLQEKKNYSSIISQCNATPNGWAVITATDPEESEQDGTSNKVIVAAEKAIQHGFSATVVTPPPSKDAVFIFSSNTSKPSSGAQMLLDIRLLLRAGYQISLVRDTSQYLNNSLNSNVSSRLGGNKNAAISISNGNEEKHLFFASDSQTVVNEIRKKLAGQILEYTEKKEKPSDQANAWAPPILLNLSKDRAVGELLDLARVQKYEEKNLIGSIKKENIVGDQKHLEAFSQHQKLSEEILESLMQLPDMKKSADLYMKDIFMKNFGVNVDPEKVFFNAFSNPLSTISHTGYGMFRNADPKLKDIESDGGLYEGKATPDFSRSLCELAIQNFPIETASSLGRDRKGKYTTGFYSTKAADTIYSSKNRIHDSAGEYIIPQSVSEKMYFENHFLGKISYYFKQNQDKFIEIQRKLAVLRLVANASALSKSGLQLGVDMITATDDDGRSSALKIESLDIDKYLVVDGFFAYRTTGGPVLLYLPHMSDITGRSYYEYTDQAAMRKGIENLLRENFSMKEEFKTRFAAQDRPNAFFMPRKGDTGTDLALDKLGGTAPISYFESTMSRRKKSYADAYINVGDINDRSISGDPFRRMKELKERKMISDAKYQILTNKELQLKLTDKFVNSVVTPLQFMSFPLLFLMPEVGAAIGVLAGMAEAYDGAKHLIEGETHQDKVTGWTMILSGGFDIAFSAYPLFRVAKVSQHLSLSEAYSKSVLNVLDESQELKIKNIINLADFNDAEILTARKATEHLFQVPDRLKQIKNDEVLERLSEIFDEVESSSGLIKKSSALNDVQKKAAFRVLAEEMQASIHELDAQMFRVKVSSEIWGSADEDTRKLIVQQQESIEKELEPSRDKAAEDFDSWLYQKQLAEDHLNSWASRKVKGFPSYPAPHPICKRSPGQDCLRGIRQLLAPTPGQPPSAKDMLKQSHLENGIDDLNYKKYDVPGANMPDVDVIQGMPDFQKKPALSKASTTQGTKIYNDAKVVYFNKALQTRIPLPDLPQALISQLANGTGEHDLIDFLLKEHNGIILGEIHTDPASRRFLIKNMPYLKSKGIDTIFVEGYTQDFHQNYMDFDFYKELATHSTSPNQVSLSKVINDCSDIHLYSGPEVADPSLKDVIQHAYHNQIEVIAIDSLGTTRGVPVNRLEPFASKQRLQGMNYYASQVIKNRIINDKTKKYIALVGAHHISKVPEAYTRWGLMNLVPSATGIHIESAALTGANPGISVATYKHELRNYFKYIKP